MGEAGASVMGAECVWTTSVPLSVHRLVNVVNEAPVPVGVNTVVLALYVGVVVEELPVPIGSATVELALYVGDPEAVVIGAECV